jgi:hypothetical protein
MRTMQRWQHTSEDGRLQAHHEAPANKLSEAERQAVLDAANRVGYASLTPHQIVPKLADEGIYLASESTFYRVLKASGAGAPRPRSGVPSPRTVPMARTRCGAGTSRGCPARSKAGTSIGT